MGIFPRHHINHLLCSNQCCQSSSVGLLFPQVHLMSTFFHAHLIHCVNLSPTFINPFFRVISAVMLTEQFQLIPAREGVTYTVHTAKLWGEKVLTLLFSCFSHNYMHLFVPSMRYTLSLSCIVNALG